MILKIWLTLFSNCRRFSAWGSCGREPNAVIHLVIALWFMIMFKAGSDNRRQFDFFDRRGLKNLKSSDFRKSDNDSDGLKPAPRKRNRDTNNRHTTLIAGEDLVKRVHAACFQSRKLRQALIRSAGASTTANPVRKGAHRRMGFAVVGVSGGPGAMTVVAELENAAAQADTSAKNFDNRQSRPPFFTTGDEIDGCRAFSSGSSALRACDACAYAKALARFR